MMEAKKNQFETINEYISTFPKNIQDILKKFREIIKKSAPKSEEMIKYRMPTFTLNNRNLVHFAAFKNHIGFFPTPSAIIAFKKELSGYQTSKGTIQFLLNQPIPFDLVRKIVKFRVNESK
jgi:uncharacterized protein YdhG (YjbR/CyaY superfamily)